MPSPSVSWTTINAADIDQDSPLTTTLLTNLSNNLLHLKEVLYGTGSYTGTIPHDHDGAEDAAICPAYTGNILFDSSPDNGGADQWPRTGGCSIEADKGFLFAASSAATAYQVLTVQAAYSKAIFGTSGADFCLSLWIRGKTSAPSAGTFEFGLADGSTSTYISGCKMSIPAASITTSWKRFYMMLSAKGASASTDVRALLKQGATPLDQATIVSGICCTIGNTLTYWEPAMLESLDVHAYWKRYGLTDCPIYDKAAAITNATQIAGV